MIAIVDYGAGNLNSVEKAFRWLGAAVTVSSRAQVLNAAEKVVLPGVGHFSALSALDRCGLIPVLLDGLRGHKPFLGICLGMQWMFEGSAEAPEMRGAGLLPGICQTFPGTVKSPHVGWNSLDVKDGSKLLCDIPKSSFVYFTHSFHAPVVDETTAQSEHGTRFSAVVEQGNAFGVQFHPEKSGEIGLKILKNFCELPC